MMSKKSASSPLMSRLMARSTARASTSTTDKPLPLVSVITPTWERRAFLPYLIYMFQYQDYPADRRELVILDDSAHSNQDLIDALHRGQKNASTIRYYHIPERLTLGQKRNQLNKLAKGEYIVCMDDDDYYPADKLSYTIGEMQQHNALFAGCDQIPIWYSHINRIYKTTAFGSQHALNGTFAYHRNFLKKHRYDDSVNLAEEEGFLHGFSVPVLQLDPLRSILCVSHSSNTFDKDFVMASSEPLAQDIDDVVTDTQLRKHFHRLSHAPVKSQIHWDFFHRIVINPQSGCEQTLQQFRQTLLAMGVSEQQIAVADLSLAGESPAMHHRALAARAQAQNWPNYLLLDDRLSFVRQEKTVANLNRLLSALNNVEWSVALLGCELQRLHVLKALPGSVRVFDARQAVAYAVNQPYYAALTDPSDVTVPDTPERQPDADWPPLMQTGLWLALYPSFAYLRQGEAGEDLTASFFRKVLPQP